MTELLEIAEMLARDVGAGFTMTDDDWPSMLVFRTAKNDEARMILPLNRTADKDADSRAVAGMLRTQRAIEAVLIDSAWAGPRITAAGTRPAVRPSLHPDRTEMLIFMHVTASSTSVGGAKIQRHPDTPPTLGPVDMGGPFEEGDRRDATAMRMAITDNQAEKTRTKGVAQEMQRREDMT